MQTHLFSYRFDGKEWEIGIKARNADEAKARFAQLAFAKYDGILVATIPAPLGLFAIVATRIRNVALAILRRF